LQDAIAYPCFRESSLLSLQDRNASIDRPYRVVAEIVVDIMVMCLCILLVSISPESFRTEDLDRSGCASGITSIRARDIS